MHCLSSDATFVGPFHPRALLDACRRPPSRSAADAPAARSGCPGVTPRASCARFIIHSSTPVTFSHPCTNLNQAPFSIACRILTAS
jgi:hypothetical protein